MQDLEFSKDCLSCIRADHFCETVLILWVLAWKVGMPSPDAWWRFLHMPFGIGSMQTVLGDIL